MSRMTFEMASNRAAGRKEPPASVVLERTKRLEYHFSERAGWTPTELSRAFLPILARRDCDFTAKSSEATGAMPERARQCLETWARGKLFC